MKKIFWLVGEKSGDLHASYVLDKLNSIGTFSHYGIGGERMEKAGLKSMFDFSRFNVMGFVEVIKHLGFFLKVEKQIQEILITNRPDLVVLVDYPGLNLRIAKIAHELGIKVLYFICPQFWAWKHKRVFKIKKYTDFVCCINPFESPLLDEYEIPNEYVGHPVAEEITAEMRKEEFAIKFNISLEKEWIGLFPGSRKMEFIRHIKVFLEIIINDPDREYLLSIADDSFLDLPDTEELPKNVTMIRAFNYDIMKHSDFVVAKSGTTTLETTLFATPFVIVYKANPITVKIARMISRVKYIGLPNLIANDMIVKELIQEDMTASNIRNEIDSVLNNPTKKLEFAQILAKIKHLLGDKSASLNCANKIIEILGNE